MNYPKANKIDPNLIKNSIMGPNPAKLLEEQGDDANNANEKIVEIRKKK